MSSRKIKKKKKDVLKTIPAHIKGNNKTRVLFYGDAPPCATGFATVSKNILMGLHETGRYDIKVLGINYWGDPHPFPFPIWPVGTNPHRDPYGRQKVADMIPKMEFDVLFFLQDSFILQEVMPQVIDQLKQTGRRFVSLCYFPIDGTPKKPWIDAMNSADVPVTYTQFGYDECVKIVPDIGKRLQIIPHGINPADFHPIETAVIRDFRRQYFGPAAEKFIFMNLNRNQQRKDIPRCMWAFKRLLEQRGKDDAMLYLHMAVQDQGWNLSKVSESLKLNLATEIAFPQGFGPNQGFPVKTLNAIYNAVDCVVSSALGEGWGLSWIEAMAAKTPVIMPNNTAITENITEDLGYLIDSGTSPNLHTILPHDNEVLRPVVDVEHFTDLMNHVIDNKEEALEKAENAYKHVMDNFVWKEHIVPKWIKLIDELVDSGPDKESLVNEDVNKKTILTESF